eukprot:6180393-Pleurochrysis_carterae.AAC.1
MRRGRGIPAALCKVLLRVVCPFGLTSNECGRMKRCSASQDRTHLILSGGHMSSCTGKRKQSAYERCNIALPTPTPRLLARRRFFETSTVSCFRAQAGLQLNAAAL